MAAPAVVEIAASPPPGPELTGALIAGCSSAGAPDGCVLAGEGPGVRPEGRPAVVVRFAAGYARAVIWTSLATREMAFRDGDPPTERFRAAGLVAGSLVAARPRATQVAPSRAVPSTDPWASSGLAWRMGGEVGFGGLEPRVGVAFGARLQLRGSPAFASLSVAYEQTLLEDALGLSEQAERLGLGGGVVLGRWGPLRLDAPAELEVEHRAGLGAAARHREERRRRAGPRRPGGRRAARAVPLRRGGALRRGARRLVPMSRSRSDGGAPCPPAPAAMPCGPPAGSAH